MEDLSQRLEAASKRRDTLAAECRRIEGKLEAAEESLRAVEAECRSKGIDPDSIDAVIEKLDTKLESLVSQLEIDIAKAEKALAPFTQGVSV